MMGLVTYGMDQFMTEDDTMVALVYCILGYLLRIYILAELLIFIRVMFSSTNMVFLQNR